MRHQQQRALERGDAFLEQFQRVDVEVVGRLVHHQQVRRPREQAREQQAVALTARQRGRRRQQLVGPEQEIAQIARHMAVLAADGHEGVAVVDVVGDRGREVELLALLVVVGGLEARAALHAARGRLDRPEQQTDQRALAGAVRPHDADAVAALDARAEAADHLAPLEGHGSVLRFEHALGRFRGLGEHELRLPDAVAAFAALTAHGLQRAHAAFVAGAARLDALADPDLLLGELAVELGVRLRFVLELQRLAHHIVVVVPWPRTQATAVELDHARREPVDEGPVVAHEQQRAAETEQRLFEPLDGGDIEVVGGLVEQQDVGIADERAREQRAPAPTARKVREAALTVEP